MFPFTILYCCINLFKELQQVTEFSPAETLLPQAYHVTLPLIRSFISFSGTDGRLRAVKYLGFPEGLEEWSSMVFHPFTNLASIPVIPVTAFSDDPCWPYGVPLLSAASILLPAPQQPYGSVGVSWPSFLQGFLIL